MAGLISYAAMGRALKRGYATASTDTGHKAGDIVFDASWALDRPDLIEDYGHRSLHMTTVNAKAVTESFYGEPARYSYYVGCSKGGQQGLMEAQRYPDDYDGLIGRRPGQRLDPLLRRRAFVVLAGDARRPGKLSSTRQASRPR